MYHELNAQEHSIKPQIPGYFIEHWIVFEYVKTLECDKVKVTFNNKHKMGKLYGEVINSKISHILHTNAKE